MPGGFGQQQHHQQQQHHHHQQQQQQQQQVSVPFAPPSRSFSLLSLSLSLF
jgi:hypothetical protein